MVERRRGHDCYWYEPGAAPHKPRQVIEHLDNGSVRETFVLRLGATTPIGPRRLSLLAPRAIAPPLRMANEEPCTKLLFELGRGTYIPGAGCPRRRQVPAPH